MSYQCPVCRKQFVILYPSLWAYKRENKYLCSYHCMRAFDRNEENKMDKTRYSRLELAEKVCELISRGEDPIAFLDGIGYANPLQAYTDIRKTAQKKRPDLWFPKNLGEWKRAIRDGSAVATVNVDGDLRIEAAEQRGTYHGTFHNENRNPPPPPPVYVATVKVDGAPKIETPEANKVEAVEVPEKMEKVNIELIKRVYPPAEELFPEFEHRITGIETQIGDFQYFRRNGYLDWTPLDGNGTVSMTVEEWKDLLKLMPLIAKRLGVEL